MGFYLCGLCSSRVVRYATTLGYKNMLARSNRLQTRCSLHGHRFIQNFCFSETYT